ncbi:hypothetical protein NMG60_11006505 [Bertholletia excelsa]
MISLADAYHVVAATIPLYVAMILAYISAKWWKLFTEAECSGINKNNPYQMNMKLICADFLQKLFAFVALATITKIRSRGNLRWIITGISLSTLPNTLILGIPILRAMYGEEAAILLSQIVVLQSIIWYNLLLFLFEVNAMKEANLTQPTEANEPDDQDEAQSKEGEQEEKVTTPRKTKFIIILSTVGKNLILNPNTHATVLGLIWASIHFRWEVNLPKIVGQSVSILADGGLGMAMFSLGLFMASRNIIMGRMVALAMVMKFVLGPVLMAASSTAIGLKGKVFRVAIVQAALPQGIVPFVFARQYNVNPDILSTGVIFGMLVALPIALAYFFLLDL